MYYTARFFFVHPAERGPFEVAMLSRLDADGEVSTDELGEARAMQIGANSRPGSNLLPTSYFILETAFFGREGFQKVDAFLIWKINMQLSRFRM